MLPACSLLSPFPSLNKVLLSPTYSFPFNNEVFISFFNIWTSFTVSYFYLLYGLAIDFDAGCTFPTLFPALIFAFEFCRLFMRMAYLLALIFSSISFLTISAFFLQISPPLSFYTLIYCLFPFPTSFFDPSTSFLISTFTLSIFFPIKLPSLSSTILLFNPVDITASPIFYFILGSLAVSNCLDYCGGFDNYIFFILLSFFG